MRRFICVVLAVMMIAALFAACGSQSVRIYKIDDATSIEADRSAVKDISCVGSFDGKDDIDIKGNRAWELYDYLTGIVADAGTLSGMPESEHLVNMSFKAEVDGSEADLGVFQVYDGGAIVYTDSAPSSGIKIRSCDKAVYDKLCEMLK